MKRCSACREVKPVAEFAIRNASRDGLQAACRECANRRQAEWRKANPKRVKAHAHAARRRNGADVRAREYARKRHPDRRLERYGLTPDAYAAILVKQGGRCATCGRWRRRSRR